MPLCVPAPSSLSGTQSPEGSGQHRRKWLLFTKKGKFGQLNLLSKLPALIGSQEEWTGLWRTGEGSKIREGLCDIGRITQPPCASLSSSVEWA